jgi:hypothetical protein
MVGLLIFSLACWPRSCGNVGGLPARQAHRPAVCAVEITVRLDEAGGGGQPQGGEQHTGEDVGGVMLAPVHADQRDRDRHDDCGYYRAG